MTERSLSISTQSATSIKPIFATTSTAISTNDVQFVTEPVDDEPYTIRCICNICEDDGNTIYCDKCETWQHIECYYSGSVEDASREDFDHLCVDCFPRDLGRHAIEKQQYRQNKVNYDNNDKKVKRPATKSHKKKTKPSEIQTNGFNDQETHKNVGSLDNHTHKRAKGHRSHHSVSSQVTKRSPPYPARSNNHPPSPSHTSSNLPNDFHIHGYSKVFQSLYDDQLQETNDNTLANLSVTNKLAMWKTDAKQFEEDVGKKFDDVVQKTKVRLDPQQFPKLHVDVKTALINNNAKAQWKSLYTTTKTPGNQPIGEINGQIGLQSDYHKNPDNGWEECPHPRPLTFFIPGLPLYIDTRGGGSQCRYIRRSCRANANLETYIVANTSEYHFYLTLDSALSPDEQITLPWDFKFVDKPRLDRALHLDGDDDDRLPDISETEYQSMAHSINLVLSDHGGCACNAGKDCAFVRFHRDYYGKVHGQPQPQSNGVNGVKSKKGRKPKQHVSPTSTGHATNSRAASEGHPEANDDDDTRSTSGSGRSKPHSRDLTPIHGLGGVDTSLTEPSDREKRKLAALENTFRKMEQVPPRKKKRASDGSNMNSPVTTTTSQTNSKPRQKSVVSRTSVSQSALASFNGSRSRQYVDASTSRRQSASPPSAASPQAMASPKPIPSRDDSTTSRSRHNSVAQKIVFVYTDSSAQTDRDEDAWYEQKTKPTPKKPVLSLARRMLLKRHKIHEQARALAAEQNQNMAAGLVNGDLQNISSPASAMDVDGLAQEDRSITQSPTDTRARNASIVSSTPSVDVISNSGDYHTDGSTLIAGQTMKPPPWPGQSTNGYSHKSHELRVQMPPTPTFITPNLSGTPGTLTPASAATSSAMSPYGTTHFSSYPTTLANGVNPSPAKKKMSLNDYKARKKQNADGSGGRKPSTGSSPTMPPAVLKSTLSTIEEAKAREILLDSKSDIIEGKEIVDPSPVDLLKVSPPKNNMPSQHSNGAL